jgi:hypothetical protein
MPIPSSYSEQELATYMRDGVLQSTAGVLGLTTIEQFDEAVNDALIAYGVSDVADATDIPKLRAAAQLCAWRLAQTVAAGDYAYSADGASYQRGQVFEHITKMLAAAERTALAFGISTGVITKPPTQAVSVQGVW